MSGSGTGDDDYKVGRGKPPTNTRFTKGRSGNPKGRPRKTPITSGWDSLGPHDIFRLGLGRQLTGNKGGLVISISAFDAIVRAQIAMAAKGDGQAGRFLIRQTIEAAERECKAKAFVCWGALEIKVLLERKLALWLVGGLDEKDIQFHPGDIEIDGETQEVRMYLMFTREQRDARNELIQHLAECEAAILTRIATAAEDGDDGILELCRWLAREQMHFINQHLAARFRREPPGESAADFATASLEPPPEVTLEASQRWYRRMRPHFATMFSQVARC